MSIEKILKDPATLLIDVRSGAEFQSGHLPKAINLPLDQIPFRFEEIDGLGKVPVVLYCRSGMRSSQAAQFLKAKGLSQIFDGGALEDVQYYLN